MSKKNRGLRKLGMDSIRFIQNWMDAVDAKLTLPEYLDLHGTTVGTVHGLRFRLRQRGIELPLLDGMRAVAKRNRGSRVTPALESYPDCTLYACAPTEGHFEFQC